MNSQGTRRPRFLLAEWWPEESVDRPSERALGRLWLWLSYCYGQTIVRAEGMLLISLPSWWYVVFVGDDQTRASDYVDGPGRTTLIESRLD